MININSYLHRENFRDLISRWMYNRPLPDDAELVTRLVHFNNVYISRYLMLFSEKVFSGMHGGRLVSRFAPHKGELKDAIVANAPFGTPRTELLASNYRNNPERYFRETPFHGTMYFLPREPRNLLIGSSRIKRVRRLAEKSARRIIDHTFQAIKRHADELSARRAQELGVSHQALISNPDEMLREFLNAENKLLDDLRHNRAIDFDQDLIINDVAGIKVILEDKQYDLALNVFDRADNCVVIEEEPHHGNYNAINLIVRYTPDKDEILSRPLGPAMLKLIERRGLDPAQASREFESFVRSGEDEVNIEVIVSNYQEMMESEIGRCIHEDRIIQQRLKQEYRGPLAKNVEYLMVFLFNFAVSPQSELGELPIKLWNRYLPDYVDEVLRSLFDIPPLRLVD